MHPQPTNLCQTPQPPYYAVIFSSLLTENHPVYNAMAERMLALAARQPGFLGVDSARAEHGLGITVSYWATLQAIAAWREHAEHREARRQGRDHWYQTYLIRICRVESEYGAEKCCKE